MLPIVFLYLLSQNILLAISRLSVGFLDNLEVSLHRILQGSFDWSIASSILFHSFLVLFSKPLLDSVNNIIFENSIPISFAIYSIPSSCWGKESACSAFFVLRLIYAKTVFQDFERVWRGTFLWVLFDGVFLIMWCLIYVLISHFLQTPHKKKRGNKQTNHIDDYKEKYVFW